MSRDPFEMLREAVRRSPENIPLRLHLAESLLQQNRAAEAEQEYRAALSMAPHDASLKVGLARAFATQQKDSEAAVVIEELLKHRDVPAEAYFLSAKLHFRAGDVERAVAHYKAAVEDDPSVADEEFAERLGITEEDDDFDDEFGEIVDGRMRVPWEDPGEVRELALERPSIRFSDVGGMESLKEEIRLKIIYPLQHAEMFAAYGKSIGGGILMYGAPGCGKTHLARATAGEINAGFLSVGINDVLDMWIGNSERNLHGIFEQARRAKPCVLFFDEVDALGARRSDMRTSGGRHLINQFLAEFDGINAANEGLLILAATNAPWHLDPAFRRPGRFDRVLFVPPPDGPAREDILKILCHEKPTEEIDYRQVAKKTDKFSGADLKAVVDRAIEAKLQEAMKAGALKKLTTKDLLQAAKQHRPTTDEWFATARNHALYANQGGVYDDILKYLKI
ncbi:MAG: AAA family ATPase [Planctomycetaceae bacterium]|nr:AAA family ATPase [Planctomycetaceae bacterium]